MIDPSITSKEQETLVFLHIPKTAGTTLHQIIERQYQFRDIVTIYTPEENAAQKSRLQNLAANGNQNIRVIKGHTFYGWHQLLSQPCTYFTLLRDPVERFISNYYFLLKKEDHPLGQKLLKQEVTLEDFICWPGEDNYQTRVLAKNIGESNLKINENECTRETFEQAEKNLQENFAVVGTVEEFDKTLLVLKKTFGWKNIFYKAKNKNKQRPIKSSISQKTLKLIEEKNQLDLELYQYATTTLQSLAADRGESFTKEVENFQSINNSYAGQFSALMSSSVKKVKKIITLS